jgi:glycyl-tRNA synthetase
MNEVNNMSEQASTVKNMDDIVALCRRRGFIWQSSEIYGGINGFWDYGPLGAQLKKNLKDAWWKDTITCPPAGPDGNPIQIVPVDTTIIMHPRVWEASGHVGGFNDPMCKCTGCGTFIRADHLWDMLANCEWLSSLLQVFEPVTGDVSSPELLKWAKGKGKKLAPNLALVKNPEVTLSWLAQRVAGHPDARPDLQEIVRYLATEQLHAVGLQNPCPKCGGKLTEPQKVSLMFESHAGMLKNEDNKVYLRPETAQGIFTQFWNTVDTSRVKVPFGMAQMGKSFRNEVTPRNFTFRSREFEQMEIEFFIHPDEANDWYAFWRDLRYQWWQKIGLAGANLTLREHDREELAHYAKTGAGVCDVEYRFPFTAPGYGELEGVAHRGNFDLTQHANTCGKGDKMQYFDQEKNERYFPHVIEPSAGADRGTLALLCEAYTPTPDRSGAKAIMKFTPRMAPIKAGIFPLVNKDGMPEIAQKLYMELREKHVVQLDVKQNIGKRYARMDEAGTPYCITIDGDTAQKQTVTIRDRDTLEQTTIALDKVGQFLDEKING